MTGGAEDAGGEAGGRAGGPGQGAYGEPESASSLELANDNAAGFWTAQARACGWETWRSDPGSGLSLAAVRTQRPGGERHLAFVLRDSGGAGGVGGAGGAVGPGGAPPEALLRVFRAWHTRELKVEDPYRVLDLAPYGCVRDRPDYTVMARRPSAADGPSATGAVAGAVAGAAAADRVGADAVELLQAADAGSLAVAERVVVEGFPVADRWPWRPGVLFPPELLGVPGARVWLAYRAGAAASACVTYDDGAAVGVYWVATLPAHRRLGVGRALLAHALRHQEAGRVATLTATAPGEPLYRGLGFVPVGRSRWWSRSDG
ncbi:GNAT family N-acetyltransferase [Phaeacidiphilus oryzae]|uniref:GNAT family N-acetyltransferase n=1 Tax=Phaeacidiphilus oryzae TaxID=348818 RepID=UPI0006918F57|nr:GNAT family N-acetyltransferase [Phaeacidiphilus oryzae]